MAKKKTQLTEAQVDRLKLILKEYGEQIAYLEDTHQNLDALDQHLEQTLNPGQDYGWEMVPGVDYGPGDYQESLSKTLLQLGRHYTWLETVIRKNRRL